MTTDKTLVTPEKIAAHYGIPETALTAPKRELITDAILDAQSKVCEYLLRDSLLPVAETVKSMWPDESYALTDLRAWPTYVPDDRAKVVSYSPSYNVPGSWDVTFNIGLDVENDPELRAILRFIRQDAIAACAMIPALAEAKRTVKSVSGEGQSISYDTAPTSPDAAGGALTVTSLRRWRRFSVGRAPAPANTAPWPYRRA